MMIIIWRLAAHCRCVLTMFVLTKDKLTRCMREYDTSSWRNNVIHKFDNFLLCLKYYGRIAGYIDEPYHTILTYSQSSSIHVLSLINYKIYGCVEIHNDSMMIRLESGAITIINNENNKVCGLYEHYFDDICFEIDLELINTECIY